MFPVFIDLICWKMTNWQWTFFLLQCLMSGARIKDKNCTLFLKVHIDSEQWAQFENRDLPVYVPLGFPLVLITTSIIIILSIMSLFQHFHYRGQFAVPLHVTTKVWCSGWCCCLIVKRLQVQSQTLGLLCVFPVSSCTVFIFLTQSKHMHVS